MGPGTAIFADSAAQIAGRERNEEYLDGGSGHFARLGEAESFALLPP